MTAFVCFLHYCHLALPRRSFTFSYYLDKRRRHSLHTKSELMAGKRRNDTAATAQVNKKSGTEVVRVRPRTRLVAVEEERMRKEKEAKENEPRRSNRDHDCIRVKGADPFYWRLGALFFRPASHTTWKTIAGNRLQIRRVHSRPHIYEIDNFLTAAELDYFDDFLETCPFQRSFVDNMQYDDDNSKPSPDQKSPKRKRRTILDSSHRTSTFFGFRHRANFSIRSIEQRTADLLGCWIHQVEGLQLVRYKPGDFFGTHHDLGDLLDDDQVLLPRKQLAVKRRLVTIFVYLNDLERDQGGCTYFPKCNDLRVQPKKGKAVLWSNIGADGYPDPDTIHAGEMVHSGKGDNTVVKYGLNVWITEE